MPKTTDFSLVCRQCGNELNEKAPIYCVACLAAVQHTCEQRIQEAQRRVDELQAKLLISESQGAELAQSLRQRELALAEMGQRINALNRELERVHQFHTALEQWLRPALDEIEKKLQTLEQGQQSSQRILEQVEQVQALLDRQGNTSLRK